MNRKMFSFGCAFFGTVALPLLASVRVRSRSDMADVMSLLVVLCLGSCYSVSGMSGGGRLNCEAPPPPRLLLGSAREITSKVRSLLDTYKALGGQKDSLVCFVPSSRILNMYEVANTCLVLS